MKQYILFKGTKLIGESDGMPPSMDYPHHILYWREKEKWHRSLNTTSFSTWMPISDCDVELIIPKECRMWVLVL